MYSFDPHLNVGLALVINVEKSQIRNKESSVDEENMKNLLTSLGYKVFSQLEDLTAKVKYRMRQVDYI